MWQFWFPKESLRSKFYSKLSEIFFQSIFDALSLKSDQINKLVIEGDRRYYNKQAI